MLSTAALEAEAELARNRHGENHLSLGERVWGRLVGHEFAGELALFGQRDESESRYSFRLDRRFERRIKISGIDVADCNRLRLLDAASFRGGKSLLPA